MVAMMGYGCLLLVVIFCPRNAAGYANGNKRVFVPPRERFLPPRLRLRSFFSVQALSAGGNRHISDGDMTLYTLCYQQQGCHQEQRVWVYMGIYGYIWVYMGIYGHIIYGYICMGIGTWGKKHYKLVLD